MRAVLLASATAASFGGLRLMRPTSQGDGRPPPFLTRWITEVAPTTRVEHVCNVFWDKVLNLRHGVPTPLTFRSVEEWREVFMEHGLAVSHVESYRPKWPTLMTYHHTLFLLEREAR